MIIKSYHQSLYKGIEKDIKMEKLLADHCKSNMNIVEYEQAHIQSN
jgi:hypothetical protein